MKYYYLNKVAMAVLVALLLFFGTRTLIDIVYQEHPPEKPGYEVAGADGEGHGKKEEKQADGANAFLVALNKADPAKGEQAIGACKVCHSFEKGGPTMIGPNLYGIVGMKIASHEGVNYSAALKDHGGEWTFENLDSWLKNPQEFAPGTTMAYPGIPDTQKRADVVAYLNKNSDDPLAIPEPKEEPAEDEAAEEGEAKEDSSQSEVIGLLASADAAKGEQAAAACKVCHSFDAGGATMVGPNLHNVVGAKIAAHEDFNYSDALKSHGGEWTYENLDAWLLKPADFAPGTTMAYPGIPDAKKRADVIKFLMSQTENPPPLPEAAPAKGAAAPADEEAAPANEEAAPAEEEAAPAEEETAPAESEEAAPAEEEAAPAEEGTGPAADEATPAEEPAAAASQESEAEDASSATTQEDSSSDVVSNPPTVSEDAPSEPSKGEPAFSNQPQPVVPGDGTDGETSNDDSAADPTEPDMSDETPSSDGGSGTSDSGSSGALGKQPEPAYPDGAPE